MRAGLLFRVGLALTLVSAIIFAWHGFLIDRLVLAPGWPETQTRVARVFVIVMGASMPLSLLGQRFLHPKLARPIAWPSSVWMGVAWIGLTVTLIAELVGTFVPAFDPRTRALTVLVLTGSASAMGMFRALRPRVNEVSIKLHNWPSALEGLSIVQLSDVHVGPMLGAGFARSLSERVNALEPDVVVVTGDLVDGSVAHVGEMVEPFSALKGRLGKFFVTGNHDFYSGADPWCARVEELGFEVLRNRHRVLSDRGASFCLAGVDDHRGDPVGGSNAGGEDLDAALAAVGEGQCTILLAHDPATFRRAHKMGVDLQISGHTHGGQIWPFAYVVRATVKWVAGLYEEGRAQIFVSRGTGFWGPPLRVGAPAEISRLVIGRA